MPTTPAIITIEWKEWPEQAFHGRMAWRAFVPVEANGFRGTYEITLVPRPRYCDRGEYQVGIFPSNDLRGHSGPLDIRVFELFHLDEQEAFPRYYFDLAIAKAEMHAWVNKREACRVAAKLPLLI
jgi:hypothetical protein